MTNALNRIEDGILSDEPLESLLQKVIIFSGQVESAELRDWATHELNGYRKEDEVPVYRVISPVLMVRIRPSMRIVPPTIQPLGAMAAHEIMKRQMPKGISIPSIEEFQRCPIREPLATIQDIVDRGNEMAFSPPYAEGLGYSIRNDNPSGLIGDVDVFFQLLPTQLVGVLSRTRTILSSFVADLRTTVPRTDDSPKPAEVEQAMARTIGITLIGDHNTVTTAGGNQSNNNSNSKSR